MKEIILEACGIEKKIQAKAGMVVVQDAPNPPTPNPPAPNPTNGLYWEEALYSLITEKDDITTPPPDTPTKSAVTLHKKSVIDLTASDDEPPPTRTVSTKAEVVVKQEAIDDNTVAKVADKGKGTAKHTKDSVAGGGGFKVAPKVYHHGNENGPVKTAKAETVLANIADSLSPQAQEKCEISRMNLLRETMNQERQGRVADERVQELKMENQALKKEIDDLRRENAHHRDRATEATTMLNLLTATNPSFMPTRSHPIPYAAMPAFATNPSLYSVPSTDHQLVEPEGIPGPGPQTMHCRQQAVEAEVPGVPKEE